MILADRVLFRVTGGRWGELSVMMPLGKMYLYRAKGRCQQTEPMIYVWQLALLSGDTWSRVHAGY